MPPGWVYAPLVPRAELLCPLCGDPFAPEEPRARSTVHDGRRALAVTFHAACSPRRIAELRAENRSPRRLERHILEHEVQAGRIPFHRARRILAALLARPPAPPPSHPYWSRLRTLRRTPPRLHEAALHRWLHSGRIDVATFSALRAIVALDGVTGAPIFPPVRRVRSNAARARAPNASPRSRRLETFEGLVLVRTLRARPHAYAYLRELVGISARARPTYRDTYLGRIDAEVFARATERQLRRLVESLLDARAGAAEEACTMRTLPSP